MTEPDVSLFPKWRQAVQDFLREFYYGDVVPHDWLGERFGMPTLRESQRLTAIQFQQRQFLWLANVDAFRHELLTKHQVSLQSVRGEGYRWVPPDEQTGTALREFERDAKQTFNKAGLRLRHVRLHELDERQRRENVDAITKVSALRGMATRALSSGK